MKMYDNKQMLSNRVRKCLTTILALCFILIFTACSALATSEQNKGNNSNTNQKSEEKVTDNKSIESNTSESKPQESSSNNEPTKVPENTITTGELKVHFIDVGQADSILVQQGNNYMLVDAGNNEDSQTLRNYLNQQGVSELEYFVGTHKDEDHIGSSDYVINSLKVGKVYFPKQTATTRTFEDFVTAVKGKGLKLTVPTVGESFKLGEATITVLAPNSSSYEDANDYSIVLKVQYGNTSFLLTGDAESVSESEMLSKGVNLSSTVLKVGHHGSKSSTSQTFLDKVNPKYAVISVGEGNSYGHPTQEIMNRLKAKNIPVYRTDENGTIVATSDGNSISFSTKPGSYNGITSNSTSSNTSSSNNTSTNNTSSSQTTPKSVPTPPAPAPSGTAARTVYYTPSGKSYHHDKNCRTLSRSKTILSGLLNDVISGGHADPCDVCVPQ
jgi:competence protein ComEC